MIADPPHPLSLVGSTVGGHYRVVREIGAGGMGVVYEAVNEPLGDRVALKVMRGEQQYSPDAVKRFEREARVCVKVRNEHVVSIFDFGELDDGAPFMVFEFLEGEDLDCFIAGEEAQSFDRVLQIMLGICEGVETAHRRGVVHRDLKPANVFVVRRDGGKLVPKVLDFGISKLQASNGESKLTKTGAVLGSVQYMAPEQALGTSDIDERADVYALGGILYYVLTGAPPFSAETLAALSLKVCYERPPDLGASRRDAPDVLNGVVQRALAKDRAQRYGSVAEFRGALVDSLSGLVATVQSVPPAGKAPREVHFSRPRRGAGWASVATAVFLGAVFTTFVAMRTDSSQDSVAPQPSALTKAMDEPLQTVEAASTDPPAPPLDSAPDPRTAVVPAAAKATRLPKSNPVSSDRAGSRHSDRGVDPEAQPSPTAAPVSSTTSPSSAVKAPAVPSVIDPAESASVAPDRTSATPPQPAPSTQRSRLLPNPALRRIGRPR